jgi:Pyruvate/2-oxoacid:ferredoxin oxidoreductase delta subunit
MSKVDLDHAERPIRHQRDGLRSPRAKHFRENMPDAARRHVYIRRNILFENREPPVNPLKKEIDIDEATRLVKNMALERGAKVVGIADYDSRVAFADAEELDHTSVVIFGMPMKYDFMADIGPQSQDEVHRVYYELDDIGLRLAHHVAALGYSARLQHNYAELPLVAYGYLAGLGELGKHGSLISPELGSSFRLGAMSTNLPLVADGPKDYAIDEFCTNCNVCTRFCPGEAILPDKREVNGIVRWHVDTAACEPYFYELYGCKICLMVCPFNNQGLQREHYAPVIKDIVATKNAAGILALIKQRTRMAPADIDFTISIKDES